MITAQITIILCGCPPFDEWIYICSTTLASDDPTAFFKLNSRNCGLRIVGHRRNNAGKGQLGIALLRAAREIRVR